MIDIAFAGITFTITLGHLLILAGLVVAFFALIKFVNYVLYDPMHAIMMGSIVIIVILVALAVSGVLGAADAEISKTGAVIMDMVP